MPIIIAALGRGQQVRLTVSGGSMTPFICDGDVVELEPILSPLQPGDVVLAQSAAGYHVIHRIVRVVEDSVWLRGDAQEQCEGPLPRQVVLGRVITDRET